MTNMTKRRATPHHHGALRAGVRDFAMYAVALLALNCGFVYFSKGLDALLEQFWSLAIPNLAGSLLVVILHRMTARSNS